MSELERIEPLIAPVPRITLRPEEAAAALGFSRDFFDEHIAPELAWVFRGTRPLKVVAVAELERWAERSATRPPR